MKRLIIGLTLVMLLMLATALPASAAIHPIVQSSCSAEDTEQADPRNPPGQIDNPSADDGMPNDGNGDDGHRIADGDDHDGDTASRHADHPFRNSNDNATSGEGTNGHCQNA